MVKYAYVLAFSQDLENYIMVHHATRDGWEMPGGRIMKKETAEQAAVREFKEETGLNFKPLASRFHQDGVGYIAVGFFTGTVAVTRPDEIDAVGLFFKLPSDLSYPHEEYMEYIDWAREVIPKVKALRG